jgi:hypothetical protein
MYVPAPVSCFKCGSSSADSPKFRGADVVTNHCQAKTRIVCLGVWRRHYEQCQNELRGQCTDHHAVRIENQLLGLRSVRDPSRCPGLSRWVNFGPDHQRKHEQEDTDSAIHSDSACHLKCLRSSKATALLKPSRSSRASPETGKGEMSRPMK